MSVIVDLELQSKMIAEEAKQTLADMRRFFEVDFGIDYTICARDEDHVLAILREADGDFAETYWVTEGPLIREIPRDEVLGRTYLEDGWERKPLNTLQLGEYCSSEY